MDKNFKKLFDRSTTTEELVDIANDQNTPELELARYYFDTSLVHSFVAEVIRIRLGVDKLRTLKLELKRIAS